MIKSVTVSYGGKIFRNYDEMNRAFAEQGAFDYKNKIASIVLAPNAQRYVIANFKGPADYDFIANRLLGKDTSNISICYCSSLDTSPLGKQASWIAGLPVCWITDRTFNPKPVHGECPKNTFER